MIKVAIIEDDPAMRALLHTSVDACADMLVTGCAQNFAEAAGLLKRWTDIVEARGDVQKRLPIAYMPVEVTASLIEARDANAFLKFLADVFDKAKDGVGTAIKDEIDPVKINERREESAAEAIGKEEALSKALVTYLSAKKNYLAVDPKNTIDLEIAYENYLAAMRALNRAREASGLAPLAPEALTATS